MGRAFYAIAFFIVLGALVFAAGEWPAVWLLLNSDSEDLPAQRAPIDVLASYFNFDSGYLYLRLNTVETPTFTSNPQRNNYYKWFVDTDNDAYIQGNQIYDSEYLLLVRDLCTAGGANGQDTVGELYIFGPSNSSTLSDFGACSSSQSCSDCAAYRVNDTNDGDYRIVPNNMDMYSSWGKIGGFNLSRGFWWATGHESAGNLNQIGTDNTEIAGTTPFIPLPHLTITKTADPSSGSPGSAIAFTLNVTNDGQANLTSIFLQDWLPAEMTFSLCSGGCSVNGQNITWDYAGILESGMQWIVSLVATINAGTPNSILVNTANVSGVSTYTNESISAQTTANVSVGNVCGISVTPTLLDFETVEVGETSSEVSAVVENTGTASTTQLTIHGGDWTSGANNFFVGQTHYNLTSGQNWEDMVALTGSPVALDDGILETGETLSNYFKLRLPLGQDAGVYTQTVTYTVAC